MMHEIRVQQLKQEILNVFKTKESELGAPNLSDSRFVDALVESIAVGFKRHLRPNHDYHTERLLQFLQLLNEAPEHLTSDEDTKHIYRLAVQKLAKELRVDIQ
jgi:hypothetical protein